MRLYFEAYTERGLTFGGIFLIADFNSIDETSASVYYIYICILDKLCILNLFN